MKLFYWTSQYQKNIIEKKKIIFHRTHSKNFPLTLVLHCTAFINPPALSLAFVKMESDEDDNLEEFSDDVKMSEKIKEKAKEKQLFKEEVGAHFSIKCELHFSHHCHFISNSNFRVLPNSKLLACFKLFMFLCSCNIYLCIFVTLCCTNFLLNVALLFCFRTAFVLAHWIYTFYLFWKFFKRRE